jgi:hypothetical protein
MASASRCQIGTQSALSARWWLRQSGALARADEVIE